MRVISFLKVPKELEAYFGIILVFFEMRRNQYIRNILFILLFFLNAHLFGQTQTFIIGTGSYGTGAIPISTGSPYSYSQSIYQSNLMTSQGMAPGNTITSLAWYVNAPNPSTSNASWTVYLANSTQSSFTSTTSWIADNMFTQVFTGTVIPSPAGWKTINLATPFVWNGSNLVIAVDENSPGNSPSPNLFLRTYLDYSTNVSIFKENNIDIIPSSPGNATGLLLDYPNIRIGICWPTPPSAITASGPTTFCAGSSVNLITNSGAGYTYQWKNNGVSISGATSQTYSATSSGNYTVNVTNFSGCSATSSATMVTVNGPVAGTVSGNQTICAGTSPANITLSGNTGTIQWQVSTDNITFTNIIGATSSPLTSAQMGSLTVTSHYRAVVSSGACASVNSSVVTATVSPISVAGTVSTNQTICTGAAPANITLSGNTGTIQWQGSGDNIMFNNIIGATASSLNSAQIGSLTSTSFYRAFVTSGVCPSVNSSAVTVTVTVNTVPTVSAGSNQTICSGNPVSLNGTGATSYSWNNGVVNGVAFIPNATQTYTVSGTDAFGCTNTAQVTVVVNALPTVSAASNQTTCSGSPITLNGTGATSYSWNNGVVNGVAFIPNATQTYTVSGTDAFGCTNTAQVTVVVNALPTVSAASNQTTCSGSPITLNGTGATSYSWNNGVVNGVAFIPNATQTYTVSGTDAFGCTNTAQVTVTVNALPTVSAGANQIVCAGTSVTLSGTGATSYVWNNGITNATAFTPVATQNYTVTATDANGCANTAQVTVTVNALPIVSAGANQTVFAGTQVTLNGAGATTYSWNNGVTNNTPFAATTTTTYTVTGTSNGCSSTDQVLLTVLPAPSIGINTNDSICSGTSTTLTASVANAGTSCAAPGLSGTLTNGLVGYWPFCGNANDLSGNGNNGTVNGATLNNDRFNSVNSAYGFNNNYIITNYLGISSNNPRSFSLWKNGTFGDLIAYGGSVDLPGCGDAFRIIDNNGTIEINTDCSSRSYQIPNYNQSNWYHIVVVGGTTLDNFLVYANSILCILSNSQGSGAVNTSVDLPVNFGRCHRGNSYYNGKIDDIGIWNRAITQQEITQLYNAGPTYLWSNGATTPSITVSPTQTTTYTCTISMNGATTTQTQTITVNALPTVSAGVDQTVCAGTSVTLSGSGATSYVWNNGVTNATAFTPVATQNYTVTGTNANGCVNTAQVQVSVNALPTVSAGANQTVCAGTSVTLSGSGATSYIWNNGITNATAFTPVTTQNYTVTGTNANGCVNTAQVQVTVNALPTVSAGANQTVCAGTSVTLSGSGATSYIWNNGITNAVAFTPVGTQNYTVTGTNMNGCVNTAQVQVVVNALPTVSAGANQTVCAGTSVTLSGTGATSYIWNNGITNAVSFTPLATQNYTITGTDANGCVNTAQVQVTVNALPIVSAGVDQTVFAGTQVTLSGVGAATYSWNNGVINNTPFTANVTTTYTLTGTTNSCTATDQVLVNVLTAPSIGATNSTICLGQNTTISATATNSGTPCASTGLQGTLTNGLVGYWPFCGNANDASQNGNNGTVNGATLTADRFGAASNAYSFNGNSRIDVGTLNTQIGGANSSWSVQCWFKSNGSLNGDMVLVTDYSSNTNSDQVVSTWLALWSFTFNNKVGSTLRNIPNGWNVLSINPYNDNQWHCMVSVSELGLLKLYIDGILINTINYNNNTNFIGSPYFRFGALLFNGQLDSYFQGQLDDIGIWNRALTQQEIILLYNTEQVTYLWSNGATTPSITVSPTQTTTYTCAISMDGASTTQSQTIIVNSPSSSTLTQSACDEFEAPDGQIYNNSGQYNAVLSNYLGCDSNIVINLQVNPSYNVWNTVMACNSYTWIDGNTYNLSNNNASYTFTSLDGCDSTIHLDLNLGNTPDTVQINASAINLYSLNGIEYNQNGTYYQLFTNQYGCDSVIMLNLAFEHTGLQVLNNSLQVFPNPSSDGIFYIYSEGINDYEIYDMIGRKVPFEWYEGRLNMSMLPKGHYLFEANKMIGDKIVIRISIQ